MGLDHVPIVVVVAVAVAAAVHEYYHPSQTDVGEAPGRDSTMNVRHRRLDEMDPVQSSCLEDRLDDKDKLPSP